MRHNPPNKRDGFICGLKLDPYTRPMPVLEGNLATITDAARPIYGGLAKYRLWTPPLS